MWAIVLEILAELAAIAAGLWSVSKALALLAAVIGIFELVCDPKGAQRVANFISNIVRSSLQIATPLLNDLEKDLQPIVTAFASSISANGSGLRTAIAVPLQAFAKDALQAATAELETRRNVKPSDWADIAGVAFSDAVEFGLGSFAVTAAFESLFPERLNTLNSLGPMLATLSGFEEITRAALGPVLYAGISQPARYDANSKFRSLMPSLMDARIMYARGKITPAQFQQLAAYAGLAGEWVPATEAVSFRPMSPFFVANAFVDQPLDPNVLTPMFVDMGLSPQNQQVAMAAIRNRSLQQVRTQYESEAIKAYEQGVLSDAELDEVFDALGWSTEARQLARSRALLTRRETLGKEVETQIKMLVSAGLMDGQTALQQLEAAGVQAWKAQLVVTLAETVALMRAQKAELKAEQQLAIKEQRNSARTLLLQFEQGNIDATALAAGLTLLGLDPTLSTTMVNLAETQRNGRAQYLWGKLLQPAAAKLLRERVAAIGDQVKKELITWQAAYAELQGLGIDVADANAIIAQWAAMIGAATKHGQLLDFLTGQPLLPPPA